MQQTVKKYTAARWTHTPWLAEGATRAGTGAELDEGTVRACDARMLATRPHHRQIEIPKPTLEQM